MKSTRVFLARACYIFRAFTYGPTKLRIQKRNLIPWSEECAIGQVHCAWVSLQCAAACSNYAEIPDGQQTPPNERLHRRDVNSAKVREKKDCISS